MIFLNILNNVILKFNIKSLFQERLYSAIIRSSIQIYIFFPLENNSSNKSFYIEENLFFHTKIQAWITFLNKSRII